MALFTTSKNAAKSIPKGFKELLLKKGKEKGAWLDDEIATGSFFFLLGE